MSQKTVSDYYDYMLPFYRLFWHIDSESNALHYGLWEKNTKNFKEALLNTNQFLANKVGLTKKDFVLDAGCGVGGSSFWIAKNFGSKVTGITISKKQLIRAKNLAEKNKIKGLVDFQLMDFLTTSFEDESFDVIWAIESVCHAKNKIDFFKEAYRVLKKGGRLVIADGLLTREPENPVELKIVDDFIHGMALPNLTTPDKCKTDLTKTGFIKIKFWDKTNAILPSSKRIYRLCGLSYPIVKILEFLKLTSPILTLNQIAGIVQYRAVTSGLGGYGVFYAEK